MGLGVTPEKTQETHTVPTSLRTILCPGQRLHRSHPSALPSLETGRVRPFWEEVRSDEEVTTDSTTGLRLSTCRLSPSFSFPTTHS